MKSHSVKKLAFYVSLCVCLVALPECSKKDASLNVNAATDNGIACQDGEACPNGEDAQTTNTQNKQRMPAVEDGAACTSHTMCRPGSACVRDICVNVDQISCSNDLDCPEFDKCYNGKCAACANDQNCSEGFACNGNGVCVPKNPVVEHCNASSDCDNGSVCLNGVCSAFCTNSMGDCGMHGACISLTNMIVGICIDGDDSNFGASCSEDSCSFYCDDSEIFLNGACVEAKCKSDDQCGENKYCSDGICKEKECNTNEDCSQGKCQHFVCRCDSDSECGENRFCDDGKCRDYECSDNNGCFSDEICHEHKCVGCVSDNDCKEEGQHCLKYIHATGKSCGDGCTFSGIEEKNETKCLECTQDSHCPASKPYCDLFDNACVECFKNGDCKDGYSCKSGKCEEMSDEQKEKAAKKKAESCSSSADCGDGYFCSYEKKCEAVAKKCTSDTDCGNDVKCNHYGYCTAEPKTFWGFKLAEVCATDDDCARIGGSKCLPNVRNVYDPNKQDYVQGRICGYSCSKSEDCESGKSCIMGQCMADIERHYCTSSSDCPDGLSCNTFYHECTTGKSVELSLDLDAIKEIMSNSITVADVSKVFVKCMSNSDCPDNLVCLASHQCGCLSNAQCGANQMCNSKLSCECISDDGCAQGFICRTPGRHSFSSRKCECASDDACGPDKLCNFDGSCVDGNNSEVLYAHGVDYHFGYIHQANPDKAISFYQKAEQAGNPLASIQLGLIELDKNKKSKDAVARIKKALAQIDEAEKNKKQSGKKNSDGPFSMIWAMLANYGNDLQYLKAVLMIRGIGMDKNVDEGLKILSEQANQMDVLSRYELVSQYLSGKNVTKDVKKASQILHEMSGYRVSPDSAYGFYQLARLVAQNPELFDNLSEARTFILDALKNAAKAGSLEAEYQLSAFFGVNDISDWELERSEEDLLNHAAKNGHTLAAKRIETMQQCAQAGNGDVSKNELEKLVQKGCANACDRLRKQYKEGETCAKALSKNGLMAGDYIQMLIRDND
ncbi:MAG: hypothetical protein J6A01_01890 [Proteobacteria bacterium]|nr:hypothetical protein [Pseudomonadota bacterium]